MPIAYTSAVTRDVTDKFGEYPTVLDWGTSTSTDFTTIIQDALDNRGGGVIFFPRIPSGTYSFGEVSIPANTTLRSERGVVFGRNATAASGRGWINIEGTGVRLENITFDGAVTTASGLVYGTGTSSVLFDNNPEDPKLTDSSTIWIHPGSDDFVMDDCEINHTSGYAVFVDVQTGNTRNAKVLNSTFRNNRPAFFGTSTATTNVGGWNSGIFVAGSCIGTNTFYLDGLTVDNCTFERNSGNQIWSHSKGFDVHHRNFTISNNRFQNIGLDCIQPGNVVNVAEFGNVCENVGFITETDADTPVARVITTAYAVAIDHSGFVDNVSCTNNTVKEVMGGAIDGDGIRNGVIANNTLFTSQSIGKGIQPGNTSANGGATNIKIFGNYIEGFTNGAIVLSEGVGITVEHNRIVHPSTAAYPPISIYSPIATPYNNIIRFNHIDYPAANWCIIEDEAGGTPWGTGNTNSVYGNILTGTNLGEFYSAAASSSLTGQYFPSNAGTLTSRNDYYVQTEGSGATTAHKWYHVTTTSAIQQMDLLLQRTSGTNDPLLRIGTASGQGCYTSGGRATLGFGDLVYTGKTLTAGFGAILGKTATGNNYVSTEADALGTAWAKMRFDETVPAIQFSTSMTSGTCNWFNLSTGGGSPGGTLGNIQYYGTGTVLAGDAAWTFNDITKQVTLAGGTATNASFTVSTGYINSAGGYLTTATAANAIQAPSGGITAKFLVPTISLIITGTTTAASGVSGAGQGSLMFNSATNRFMYSENGTALANAFGNASIPGGSNTQVQFNDANALAGAVGVTYAKTPQQLTVTATSSALAAITASVGYIDASAGFLTTATPTNAIQAPSGGVTAKYLVNTMSLTMTGTTTTAAGVSSAGQGRLMFDSATNKFMYSENGTAFANAFGAGGTPGGSTTQFQFNDAGVFNGAAGLTYSKTPQQVVITATNSSLAALTIATGYVDSQVGYYTAGAAATAINAPNGGGTSKVWISVRNDGDSGLVLSRTSATARDYGFAVNSSGQLIITDRTASATRLTFDTSGNLTVGASVTFGSTGSLVQGSTTRIDSSGNFTGASFNATSNGFAIGGTTVINNSSQFSGASVTVTGGVNSVSGYTVSGNTIINSSGILSNSFGVDVNAGVGATGFNIHSGPTGKSGSWTTVDGKTITATNGIITSIV